MPMQKTFDAANAEKTIYQRWEKEGCFKAGANAKRSETFSIMIPPPNVTGSLHVGHAFNNTLQDILIRWHRMRGFDTLWQPGQDHAGIATQMVVERELAHEGNLSRRDIGRDAFLEKVWEWKERSGDTIIQQLRRLGASCDWSRNAFTMDAHFHQAVLKVFVDLYHKGLIYRGKRLVNWDPHFETAISDLEVENIEIDGHFWHFKYPLENGETYTYVEKDSDGNIIFSQERDYISIATTRPETMLGDGAVAVHPSDTRYAPIIGKRVLLPLANRYIPIIADEYPDPDFGSGAVKITGAHDFNDYDVAMRHGIALFVLMDSKGCMLANDYVPTQYQGMDRFEARKAVVADLDTLGLLIGVEDKKIMQPFGDRSKVVIEPMLTDQWFVDTAKIVQPAIDAVKNGQTKIIPEHNSKVYFHWLDNIEPWCISRQLWWGHQIPVWYDKDGNPYCATSEDAAKKMANGQDLTRDLDVLDTWFSSGIWPIGTLGWPENTPEFEKYFPTDVLVTGFDILFFWVARMMMMQLAIVDQVPFHTVYVHALVRDKKGKKMSKSLGNVIDPIDLIDEYGADAVRFTLTAMAAMGRDLKLSKERVAGYRNFGTKLWNATRFAEMNKVYDTYQPDQKPTPTATVNRWIIGETARVKEALDIALTGYRFNDAANVLYAFVWGKVCDWYVEFAKPLFGADDSDLINETRQTMGWVLDQCLILLHPIMPFITEELWGLMTQRSNMLIHQEWPTYTLECIDSKADQEMNWVISLIEEIRSVRTQMHVPAGAKIPMIQLELDAQGQKNWQGNAALIQRMARISELTIATQAPKASVALSVEGGSFCLPLEGVIDIAKEQDRLEKNKIKLEKEKNGLKGRLDNEKFLKSAPPEVVEESFARLTQINEDLERIDIALSRLENLV